MLRFGHCACYIYNKNRIKIPGENAFLVEADVLISVVKREERETHY